MERAALPDGTRVLLVCPCGDNHDGVWRTSWTPRRVGDIAVDDYQLTRETDGEVTYATRDVLQVLGQ